MIAHRVPADHRVDQTTLPIDVGSSGRPGTGPWTDLRRSVGITTVSADEAATGAGDGVADGAAGEVMTTDGAGNLGWIATAEVVPAPSSSVDPGAPNQIAFGPGFFYFFDGTQWLQIAGTVF